MKYGYNPKNYKTWLQQKRHQAKYPEVERLMMAQLQQETQQQELAEMGIQQQYDDMEQIDEMMMEDYGESQM